MKTILVYTERVNARRNGPALDIGCYEVADVAMVILFR